MVDSGASLPGRQILLFKVCIRPKILIEASAFKDRSLSGIALPGFKFAVAFTTVTEVVHKLSDSYIFSGSRMWGWKALQGRGGICSAALSLLPP